MALDLTVYPLRPVPFATLQAEALSRLVCWDPRLLPGFEAHFEPWGTHPLTPASLLAGDDGACLFGSVGYGCRVSVSSTFDDEESRWWVIVHIAHRSNRSLALLLAVSAGLAALGQSNEIEDGAQAFGFGETFSPADADRYVMTALARWPEADPADAIAWASRRWRAADRPPPTS